MYRYKLVEDRVPLDYRVIGSPEWLDTVDVPDDRKIAVEPGRENRSFSGCLDWLRSRGQIAVDSETGGSRSGDGLDPISQTSTMLLWQTGDAELQLVTQPDLFLPYQKEQLQDTASLKIGVNLVFDFEWLLKRHGIHPRRRYCCMLAEQILTAGLSGLACNMRSLARRYPPHYIISKEDREIFDTVRPGDPLSREAIEYAARDVVLPMDIMRGQVREMAKQDLVATGQLEFNVIPVTAEMELTGVCIDQKKLDIIIGYFKSRLAEANQRAQSIYRELGGREENALFDFGSEDLIDLQSNPSKLKGLSSIGIETDNMQRATLKSLLEGDLLGPLQKELVGALIDYSLVFKMVTTYGDSFKARIHAADNRIHPSYFQLGAGSEKEGQGGTISTGRFSGDMQQIPKPSETFAEASPGELAALRLQFPAFFSRLEKSCPENTAARS